jgi:hydrogenase maturation protease
LATDTRFPRSIGDASPFSGKTLIIGFGNPDRQDDGVAWHVLSALAERLGRTVSESIDDDLDRTGPSPNLVCMLQLTPEVAETLARYDRVCFVDAHTGAYEEDIRFETIEPDFQSSPFTHHMTPHTCLVLAETLYGHAPQATVVSVRGHQFGFSRNISPETTALAAETVKRIGSWLEPAHDSTAE